MMHGRDPTAGPGGACPPTHRMLFCAARWRRGAVAQFGRARESHSRGRRFDPGQLHQLPTAADSPPISCRVEVRLDRTGDLTGGFGGRNDAPRLSCCRGTRPAERSEARPVRSRSAPPVTSLPLARALAAAARRHSRFGSPAATGPQLGQRASTAGLIPRRGLAPAARGSSLDYLGRLLAPRAVRPRPALNALTARPVPFAMRPSFAKFTERNDSRRGSRSAANPLSEQGAPQPVCEDAHCERKFVRAADHLPDQFNAARWFIGRHVAEGRSGDVAIVTDSERVSYGNLDRRVRALAGALRDAGIHGGDRVALILPDGPLFAAAFWGAIAAGAVAVPLNPRAPAREAPRDPRRLRPPHPRVRPGPRGRRGSRELRLRGLGRRRDTGTPRRDRLDLRLCLHPP